MSFLIFAAPIIFIIIFVIFIAVFSSDSKKYRRNLDNNKQMQLDEARENALKAVEQIRRNKNESNYSGLVEEVNVSLNFESRKRSTNIFRMLKKNKMAMLGLIILVVLVLLALFADVIANYDTVVIKQNLAERLMPPNGKHWLGTDEFGRDIFARLIHGARVSLKVGILAISISVVVGGILGAVSFAVPSFIDATKLQKSGHSIIQDEANLFTIGSPKEDTALVISYYLTDKNPQELSDTIKADAPAGEVKFLSAINNDQAYVNEFEAQGFYSYIIVPKKEKVKNQHTYATYVSSKKLSKNDLSKITNAILDEAESYIK